MDLLPRANEPLGRPDRGSRSQLPPIRRARQYQDLARRHPEDELFWLCRASYFGRISVAPR
jgi:hypothetical protein